MGILFQRQDSLTKNGKRPFHSDSSFWALIISNLIAIIWALIEGWSLGIIMWVYWSQSVAIGILWFFKMLTLKEFSTEGVEVNDRPVKPTTGTKIEMAFFFLVHYGFFHFIYASFLRELFEIVRIWPIPLMAGIFVTYQCYSFFHNKKWKGERRPNIGKIMLFPYIRIIPMHFTIILGGALGTFLAKNFEGAFAGKATLALFMLLKTVADVIMHRVEQKGFGDRPTGDNKQK